VGGDTTFLEQMIAEEVKKGEKEPQGQVITFNIPTPPKFVLENPVAHQQWQKDLESGEFPFMFGLENYSL
jgi:hypothetical protein